MAKKTVYIPDDLMTQLEQLDPEAKSNLSRSFQEFLTRKADKALAAKAAFARTAEAKVFERWRPSKVREIAKGVSSWTMVDCLMGQPGGTSYAIRGVLEDLGARVNLFPVGTAQHAVNVLSGHESSAPFLIIAMDADSRGFLLPRLAKGLEEKQTFHIRLTSEDLTSIVDLPGRAVISFGGGTGTETFAKAFLDNGCIAYFAPGDPKRYPFRYACTFVTGFIFYELVSGRSLEQAVDRIRLHDEELSMWKLYR